MRIFLDLDGVLVNFEKGYIERVNEIEPDWFDKIGYKGGPFFKEMEKLIKAYYEKMSVNEKELSKAKFRASAKFWSFINGDAKWWLDLEWMPGGRELFDYCLTLRKENIISELNVLSSPSISDRETVINAKKDWLKKHGIFSSFDQVIIDSDKSAYCKGSGDILIDDTLKKINSWNDKGGYAIHHTELQNTIEKLNYKLMRKPI